MGKVLGIFSAPGGVGKTTLAANLAWLFRESDYRVLLIDLDPSISLSWLVVKEQFHLIDYESKGRTITEIIRKIFDEEKEVDYKDYLISRGYPSPQDLELDLLMPDLKLTEVIDNLWINRPKRELIIDKVIRDLGLRDEYDLVIIDTIPFFDRKYTVMLIYAADRLLVPLRPTIIDVYRTQTILRSLPKASALSSDEIYSNIGLVFNMVRTTKQKESIPKYKDLMMTKLGNQLRFFDSSIGYYVSFSRIGTEEEVKGDRNTVKEKLRGLFEELREWI